MRFISAPFRSGLLVRSSPRNPTLHFAYISSIHLSTAQLREILISISQAHSFRFPQALFQRISNGLFFILRRVHPDKRLSGRAVSLLHLNGELLRLRQPENNAPKTTCNFHWRSISGSNENYKRFSKYGDRCQAPFQAACKLFSTSCNILNFPTTH